MSVPTRYILAAIAFAVAALGLLLLPVGDSDAAASERPRVSQESVVSDALRGRTVVLDAACDRADGGVCPASGGLSNRG